MKKALLYLGFLVLLTLGACSSTPNSPSFIPSASLPNFQQPKFNNYLAETKNWLAQNRVFVSTNKEFELQANTPFERQPATYSKKAVLFFHGLGDSPYSFTDIADDLIQEGYVVRSILLPGHGSRPADLMLPNYEDWEKLVRHHVTLAKKDFDEIWLGGFSTGANLATDYALQDESINGLLLFSPAFKTKGLGLIKFAYLAKHIFPWADAEPEDNMVRYNSIPTNAGALYNDTSEAVTQSLDALKSYDKPVFIALAQDDSVVDTNHIRDIFQTRFQNPQSHLFWMGNSIPESTRISQHNMDLPELKISTGSHMHTLFKPSNPLYGINGEIRICENGQGTKKEALCFSGADVWYSRYGHQAEDKIHARLTWNPHFDKMTSRMNDVMQP